MKDYQFIFLFIFLIPMGIYANPISISIEWKDVKGSKGYLVQWRILDSDKSELEEMEPIQIKQSILAKKYFELSIPTNNVKLELEPGYYAIRVAGKNAFGKPGKFSDWRKFEIQSNQKNQSLDLSQQETKEPELKYAYSLWEALIPGFVQWKQGKKYSASIYGFLIPTIAIIGFQEKIRGDAIAKDKWNDPMVLGLGLLNQPVSIQSYAWIRRQNEKSKYKMSQDLQTYAIGGILTIFLIHGLDLYFFSGQGIIQSASWSEDHFNRNPISEIRQGIQFQVSIDL